LISSQGTDGTVALNFSAKGGSSLGFYTNSYTNLVLALSHTASSVNYLQIAGSATGVAPNISPQGSDGSIAFNISSKGNAGINFYSDNLGSRQFRVERTLNSVNFLAATGGITGSPASLTASTLSSDTDVGINLTAKGNGSVNVTSTLASTSNTTGSLVVSGGLGVGGNVSMNLASSGTGVSRLTLSPQSYFSTFNAGGDIAYNGPSGAAFLFNNSQVYIQNQLIQRGIIFNDSGNNTVVFGASSPVKILNATSSTNTTTGALIVQGGVGISGALNATTKSFNIPHPTKSGKSLRYGSLEGPEFGVYVRGTLKGSNTIQLPDYWIVLADPDSITVQLTAIGKTQNLFVKEIRNNKVIVGVDGLSATDINCYYTVFGERADVAKLEVEG